MANGELLRRAVSRGINELYQDNHNRNEYNDVCNRNIEKLWRKYLKTVAIIIISMTIAHSSSVYLYFKYGKRVTITELKFPFIGEGSDMEFKLNICTQALYGIYMFSSNIGAEGISIFLYDGISLSSKLIKLRLKNLSNAIEKEQMTTNKMKSELLIVLHQINRVNTWITEYYDAAYWRYFLTPTAYSYTIGLSIYCQYVVSLLLLLE